MAIYTPSQLAQLWIDAGGNPQYAQQAADLAVAKSGGNPSGNGLWGLRSNPSSSPMDEARAAVAASNNGRDFAAIGVPTRGPFDLFSNLIGVGETVRYLEWATMIFAGAVLMMIGVSLMVLSSRKVREIAGVVGGSILSGTGFGLGANLATGGRAVVASGAAAPPPAGGSSTPAPTRPPTPPGPRNPDLGIFAPTPERRRAVTSPTLTLPEVPKKRRAYKAGPASVPPKRAELPDGGGTVFRSANARRGGRHRA